MNQCTGNCNCCPCLYKAQSIATEKGITTITITDDALTDLCAGEKVCVGIFTSFDTTTECNRIKITDGTTTLDVVSSNQYFRLCKLKCRSILRLTYVDDPALLVKRG